MRKKKNFAQTTILSTQNQNYLSLNSPNKSLVDQDLLLVLADKAAAVRGQEESLVSELEGVHHAANHAHVRGMGRKRKLREKRTVRRCWDMGAARRGPCGIKCRKRRLVKEMVQQHIAAVQHQRVGHKSECHCLFLDCIPVAAQLLPVRAQQIRMQPRVAKDPVDKQEILAAQIVDSLLERTQCRCDPHAASHNVRDNLVVAVKERMRNKHREHPGGVAAGAHVRKLAPRQPIKDLGHPVMSDGARGVHRQIVRKERLDAVSRLLGRKVHPLRQVMHRIELVEIRACNPGNAVFKHKIQPNGDKHRPNKRLARDWLALERT
eukprot:comp21629_c0_seq1/m.47774 comp21629_c0_seq1/g.47774  ORF comp21629_c0_seq1/g.47774 comp21629_c0_seq1/m.47774 type:complete len:321 (+) comp21629_c0_seq1:554-1516(+)